MMWRSDTNAGRTEAPQALIATSFLLLAWARMPKTSFRKNSSALDDECHKAFSCRIIKAIITSNIKPLIVADCSQ